jgi:HAD superfamily hydrolase (TIGR01509 family)
MQKICLKRPGSRRDREGEEGMAQQTQVCSVAAILFDYGGVLAEEGFRNGLRSIGIRNGLDPEFMVAKGSELVYRVGYVTGQADEKTFWDAIRRETGIPWGDHALREEILSRFRLRPGVLEIVHRLREEGLGVFILSDQTNWLDELEDRDHFFSLFDQVYNSYHLGKGKKDPTLFDQVAEWLKVPSDRVLFIDDTREHIERARGRGFQTIWFSGEETFRKELLRFCPFLDLPDGGV